MKHARPTSIEEAQKMSYAALLDNDKAMDRYMDAMDATWERERSSSTCGECEHCLVAPEAQMQAHVKYMVDYIHKMYQKRDDVIRTDESLEYEVSRNCSNARLLCAWCDEYNEFVDAESTMSQDCPAFSYVGI